jgi:hypothetical protein
MSTRPATTSTIKPAALVYVATAPLVLVKDTTGRTHHVYDGEPLPEHAALREVERLLGIGFIAAA